MKTGLPIRSILILGLVAALSLGAYLLWSAQKTQVGFPLDDAWIHQTYARNLALRGEWSFLPGEPSAGSTAPLWSLLLTPGYLLGASPFTWTFILEWLLLWGLALLMEMGQRRYLPRLTASVPWAGLLAVLEWHLVWAAGSGMETLLQALLITAVLIGLEGDHTRWALLGAGVGLSAWVRPDGITLLGPLLFTAFLAPGNARERTRRSAISIACFAALFLPYLLFNFRLAGTIWPNTYFAKQAEYAIYQKLPLSLRYLGEFKLPLIGTGSLLLPGAILFAWGSVRGRRWNRIGGLIWWLGYLGIYALRLPVDYQHGRYIIPAMPIFFLWGTVGLAEFVLSVRGMRGWEWVVGRAWSLSAILVLSAFWVIGGNAYATDVAIINTEMVRTAQWIAANTPAHALVAAHDIGALGFYSQRRLVDLAGLVSPEVIPFIRDETRIAEYLDAQKVDYLVTFPTWYPQITDRLRPVFITGGTFAPSNGGENMAVYQWGLGSSP
jgi:arabinofuranosyltransferase